MRYRNCWFIVLILLLAAAGCVRGAAKEPERMPGISTPLEAMNTYFRIASAPEFGNSFKNGEDLGLWIRNLSDETITFPGDYGFKMFIKDGENWVTIENLQEYSSLKMVLPPEKEYILGLYTGVYPYIPGMTEKTTVRIVIVGSIKDRPEEEVAAYLDVVLRP